MFFENDNIRCGDVNGFSSILQKQLTADMLWIMVENHNIDQESCWLFFRTHFNLLQTKNWVATPKFEIRISRTTFSWGRDLLLQGIVYRSKWKT